MNETVNKYKIDFGPYQVEMAKGLVYFRKNNSLVKTMPIKSTFSLYDLKKLAQKVAKSVNMLNKLPKDVLKAGKEDKKKILHDTEKLNEMDIVRSGFMYHKLIYKVRDAKAVMAAFKAWKGKNRTINIEVKASGNTITFSGHKTKGYWMAPHIADSLDVAIQKTGKADLDKTEGKKLKEGVKNEAEFRNQIREIASGYLNEGKVNKNMWKKMSDDEKENALLTVLKDPDDRRFEDYLFSDWNKLPGWVQRDMRTEGKLNELSKLTFRDAGIKNLADLRIALDVARDNKIWWDQKDNQQALYFKNAKELKRFKKAYGLDEGKLNEVTAKATWENAVNALTKTIGGKKFDKGYVKDYLKQIERMARKNPGQFVKDYGDFKVGDWIEDVRYNMANESVNENVGAAYNALLKVSKDKKWIANVKKMSKSQLKKVSDQFTKDYHRGHIWTGSKEDMRKMQYVDALLKEGKLNEISVKAGLQDVLKGRTTSIEGIKISKGLAMAITTWIAQSSFGRKYNKQILKGRIGSLIKPMASWGLDRFLDSKTRPEWKQILSKHQRGIK